MCLDAAKEVEIRTALKTKIANVLGTEIVGVTAGDNVFETPYFFANRGDFAATLGIDGADNIKALEIKFVQLQFMNFIDTGGGTDECPELNVNYDILLYRQFIQIRDDVQGSRPYNDFLAWEMRMMKAFFQNREILDDVSILSLSQPSFISVREESRFMPGELGIFTSLRATLEVT